MDLLGTPSILRFGHYVVDLRSGELRKNGIRIRLQEKPLRVLVALMEREGELVTREELHKRLWPDATFVDFEDGLNTAVRKLRGALCDDAEQHRYIETIPRRGYRFVVPIEFVDVPAQNGSTVTDPDAEVSVIEAEEETPATKWLPPAPSQSRRVYWWIGAAAVVLVMAAAGWFAYHRRALTFHTQDTVLVADFENQTGDPRFDDALNTAFIVSLAQSRYANVFPRSRLVSVLKRMGKSGSERITPALGREICVRENIRGLVANTITRTGQQYEITTQLIDPGTDATVRAYTERSNGEDHILDALGSIASQVRADLGESLSEIQRANRPLPEVTTSSLMALKQYAEGTTSLTHAKYDEAVALYKSAVELDPNFAIAHSALGRVYCSYRYYQMDLCRREYDKALALSSRLTEREKMVVETQAATDFDHTEEADRLYRNYLALYPDDWAMRRDYAHLLRKHGRQLEAIEQLKRILLIAPDDDQSWIEMATAESGLWKFSEALQAYSQAFRIDPNRLTRGNVNREYGMALVGNGEEQKAISVFSNLLENPKYRENGLRSLALLNLYHGRYAAAEAQLKDALQIEENTHDPFAAKRIHFLLAVIAEGRGDKQNSQQELDASAAGLSDMGMKVQWGSIVGQEYVRTGALSKAEKIAEFIAPLADVHNNEEIGYVRLLQGAIAAEKGQTEKAIALLALSDPIYGSSVNALSVETLAHTYQRAGNLDHAILEYEKFAAPINGLSFWEPQQRWAAGRYDVAEDYARAGQPENAQKALATLLDLWKDADPDLPLRKSTLQLQAHLAH